MCVYTLSLSHTPIIEMQTCDVLVQSVKKKQKLKMALINKKSVQVWSQL